MRIDTRGSHGCEACSLKQAAAHIHFEARSFRHACLMGLEGLVSKHRDRPYRSGRSPHWIKVKNRKHPAMERVMESF